MVKIGECRSCGGDIVETPVSGSQKSGFGPGLVYETTAYCIGCGSVYNPGVVKQLNHRPASDKLETGFVRTWGVREETPVRNSRG